MALFRIDKDTVTRLVEHPESGMGYQIVRHRGTVFVIFNAAVAIPFDELRDRQFTEVEYSSLAGDPDHFEGEPLPRLSIEGELSIAFSLFDRDRQAELLGLNSPYSVVTPSEYVNSSSAPRSYYRYCSYYRDRRIHSPTGNFLPGTFATTFNDIHFVPSGFAAVGRYALPNPASARFLFQIVTFDRPNLIGTATPNFGQAGGGVEVLFEHGAVNKPSASFPIAVG